MLWLAMYTNAGFLPRIVENLTAPLFFHAVATPIITCRALHGACVCVCVCVCVVTQSFLEKVVEFCIFYDSSVKN